MFGKHFTKTIRPRLLTSSSTVLLRICFQGLGQLQSKTSYNFSKMAHDFVPLVIKNSVTNYFFSFLSRYCVNSEFTLINCRVIEPGKIQAIFLISSLLVESSNQCFFMWNLHVGNHEPAYAGHLEPGHGTTITD